MVNMAVEIPDFKRCCFCLPLRPGLLAWGYFKIIADVLITPVLGYLTFVLLVTSLFYYRDHRDFELIIYSVVLLLALITVAANFVATLMFIVGGHKKSVKLIRGFYIYSIWELILTTLLIVAAIGISIVKRPPTDITMLHLKIFGVYVVILILHAYFILLLRSEVIKLNGSGEFSFENNPAETQCMMTSKEKE